MNLFFRKFPIAGYRLLRRNGLILDMALALSVVALAWGNGRNLPDKQAVQSDARAYTTLAVNLWRHGVFSLDEADVTHPVPTQYREPGYPAFLALAIGTQSDLRRKPMEKFHSHGSEIRSLKRAGLVLYVAMSALIFALVRGSGGSRAAAFGAGLLVALSRGSQDLLATTLSEHLSMVAMAAVSLALIGLARKPGTGLAALGGLALAVLVLTKTVFQLFLPLALAWVWGCGRSRASSTRWIAVAAFAVGYVLPIGAWKLRNAAHFGNTALVAGRSGVVLMTRALKDTMTADERRAAWIYWMPEGEEKRRCAISAFGNRFEEVTRRLDRSWPGSYYRQARAERDALFETGDAGPLFYREVDRQLARRALDIMRRNVGAHVALTPAFAWRCLFADRGLQLCWPFEWKWDAPLRWTALWAGGLFLGVLLSVIRRDPRPLALALPSLFLLGAQALMTHCIPRYGLGLVPFGTGALALVGDTVVRSIATRYKRGRNSETALKGI